MHLASPLRSYFEGRALVEVEGRFASLDEVLLALDARSPGVRFRMVDELDRLREHLKVVVSGRSSRDLSEPLPAVDGALDVHVLAALSGG